MAQAHSAQIQQDLLGSDQERLYREVMQESYNTIFRADDDVASEKEEDESVPWENQRITKPRAALLGQWETVQRQGKACKIQHGRLQDSRPRVNCADGKKKGLVAGSNSRQGMNTEDSQNECTVCGKNFGRRSSLLRHFKVHSGDKPFRCSICGKCFLAKTSLVLHKESMHKKRPRSGKKRWECCECGQAFATKAALTEHHKMHSSEKTHPCPACEESFAETRYLVKHLMTTHSGDHVFKCPVCGKGFMKEKDLVKHQAKNHGESHCFPSLGGENCCKEKPSPINHKRLHLNPEILPGAACEGKGGVGRSLTCGHCGKSYKQEKAFLNHQSVCVRQRTNGEGKVPKEDGPLTKNQITHVEMKDNTCFDCGKPVCKSSLLASQPKADQEKNLQVCPECGESFRDGQDFENHLRSHQKAPSSQSVSDWEGLGEKTLPVGQPEKKSRYQCRGCRRDYSTHYNLRRHQRIHVECRYRRNAHKGKDSAYSWFFLDFPKPRSREQTLQHKCTFCGKAFKTKSTLGRHHQIHIKGKPYKCTICGKAFVYRYTLAHHQEIHLEDQLYQHKCSFCTKAFRTPSALRRHQQLHKEGKPYICNICGKAFAYRYNLTHHREIHIEGQIYKCSFCWKAFRTSYSLSRHKRIHTETRSYQCPTCRKAFGTKYSLWRHQEMHVKEDPDSLLGGNETGDNLVKDQASGSDDGVDKQLANSVHSQCQEFHKERKPPEGSLLLPDHQSTSVEENAIKQLESQTFRSVGSGVKGQDRPTKGELQQWTNGSLYTGQGTQTEEGPPVSSENGDISFGHLGNSAIKEPADWCFLGKLPGVGQQGMVPQEKKYSCPNCGKSFRDKYSLTRHQKVHFPERPYPCPRCDKSFRSAKDLEKHQVSHSDQRPHQCGECGKYLKTKYSLDKHQKTHKGEKPFCCSYCGRRVTTSTILRYHQRTHTGERPYKCAVCDKSYISKWSLKKHLELHYKTNPPKDLQEASPLDQKC
ncbi:zinc finger protein 189-like isoform X4 [Ahaetulla prasina]|uniref:zinc finger protein 189-like isoform X4 n=1 Tax=Ahaetulla prasina TaxID=499056 RepID=UPI00264905B3|nr:zinc finger protein 189-like isoform X4 [Ahaetulla prasina]